jgi:plasmid stabilization system protein ParE
MKVVLSATAKFRLLNLLEYLENKWSTKVKDDFIKKLDRSIVRISKYPESCPKSSELEGLHKCVVTKHNTFFYLVKTEEIEIVTLFDTRQNPSKKKFK